MDENVFSEAIQEGFKNEEFRNLVIWLANEISELAKMEERVKDAVNHLVELSANFIISDFRLQRMIPILTAS